MAATISKSSSTHVKRATPDSTVKNTSLKKYKSSFHFFDDLLPELHQKIFEFLTLQELVRATFVSRKFKIQARMKIEHHASRLFFSPDKREKTSLRDLCLYIQAVQYMIIYLSQNPQKLAHGFLQEALCWNDPKKTSVDIRRTLQQLQFPFPERDCRMIYRMASERYKSVDCDHRFIHGARSLPRESRLTIAIGIFFQFVETIKVDTCLTEKICQDLQNGWNLAISISTQKVYRQGMMERLMLYRSQFKA